MNMVDIVFHDDTRRSGPFEDNLSQFLSTVISREGHADSELNLVFCNDEFIHSLNKQYRGKDLPTDVLSFSQLDDAEDGDDGFGGGEDGEAEILGDVVVSLDRAKAQAEEAGVPLDEEIARLSIHGTLHILGYDHETGEEDEREMFEKQDALLEEFLARESR
jgi:probable rRNA maturation factor